MDGPDFSQTPRTCHWKKFHDKQGFLWVFAMKTIAFGALLIALAGMLRAGDDLKPGLVGVYYEFDEVIGDFPKIPADKKPSIRRVDKQVNVENSNSNFNNTNIDRGLYVKWSGFVKIEKQGKYKFFVESDEGSRLSVDSKPVVNNSGTHPMEKKGGEVDLAPGQHEIKLEYFQGDGQMGCKFSWAPPGKNEEIVPEAVLWHNVKAE